MHSIQKLLPRITALALAVATVGACRDDAPTGAGPVGLSVAPGSLGTTSFVVSPAANMTTVNIGEHKIKFEANAICDPLLSSYGTTEWDKPCVVAKTDVRITATYWIDEKGFPQIDFQPALRFNPASNVTLYMMDKKAATNAKYQIFWVDPLGQVVDEAATDPSVATMLGSNGHLYRRIKHFSGYLISSGRDDSSMSDSY